MPGLLARSPKINSAPAVEKSSTITKKPEIQLKNCFGHPRGFQNAAISVPLRINIARTNCIPRPVATSRQLMALLLLLKAIAISSIAVIPMIPRKISIYRSEERRVGKKSRTQKARSNTKQKACIVYHEPEEVK